MPVKQRGHKHLIDDASTVVLCRVYIRRTTEIEWEKHLYTRANNRHWIKIKQKKLSQIRYEYFSHEKIILVTFYKWC